MSEPVEKPVEAEKVAAQPQAAAAATNMAGGAYPRQQSSTIKRILPYFAIWLAIAYFQNSGATTKPGAPATPETPGAAARAAVSGAVDDEFADIPVAAREVPKAPVAPRTDGAAVDVLVRLCTS